MGEGGARQGRGVIVVIRGAIREVIITHLHLLRRRGM
jgi:hypothetical protein